MTKTKKRAKYKKGDLPLPTPRSARDDRERPPSKVWVLWEVVDGHMTVLAFRGIISARRYQKNEEPDLRGPLLFRR